MPPSNRWNDPDVYDVSRNLLAELEMDFAPRLWLYFKSLPVSMVELLCSLLADYQLLSRDTKTVQPEHPVFERKISFDSETLFLSECGRVASLLSTATGKHWPLQATYHGRRCDSTSYSANL